jgi:hypothetical protein
VEKLELFDILMFLGTIFSLVVSFYCVKKAEKLNRSRFGWALFGLCLPLIAVIVVQYMKPLQD